MATCLWLQEKTKWCKFCSTTRAKNTSFSSLRARLSLRDIWALSDMLKQIKMRLLLLPQMKTTVLESGTCTPRRLFASLPATPVWCPVAHSLTALRLFPALGIRRSWFGITQRLSGNEKKKKTRFLKTFYRLFKSYSIQTNKFAQF